MKGRSQMTSAVFGYDHIMMRAEYRTPDPHSHLAVHFIAGLDGPVHCVVSGDSFDADAVFIASDVVHTAYAKKLKLYNIAPIADRITQDMLIVGANQDHFIDYRMVGREINMLKNVKSLTFRLFTDKEDAQNHCNVGNGKLVLDNICSWIEQISSEVN